MAVFFVNFFHCLLFSCLAVPFFFLSWTWVLFYLFHNLSPLSPMYYCLFPSYYCCSLQSLFYLFSPSCSGLSFTSSSNMEAASGLILYMCSICCIYFLQIGCGVYLSLLICIYTIVSLIFIRTWWHKSDQYITIKNFMFFLSFFFLKLLLYILTLLLAYFEVYIVIIIIAIDIS